MDGQKGIPDKILVLECLVECGYPLDVPTMVFHLSGKTDIISYWKDFSNLLAGMRKEDLITTTGRRHPYSRTHYTFTEQGLGRLKQYREKLKVNA